MIREHKWVIDKSRSGEQLYRLRADLCPSGIGVIVVPYDGRFAIAATWNRQRFYLVNGEDKPRTYSRLENAKTLAEQLAQTADQVRAERSSAKKGAR
jgi:hypothetical protein